MRKIFTNITTKNTDHFLIKKKNGHNYKEIARYKNNIFNRIILSHKTFDKNGEYFIVPEFQNIEGRYIKVS